LQYNIISIAVAVVFICNRLKIPSIVGFMITGVFSGPGREKLNLNKGKINV